MNIDDNETRELPPRHHFKPLTRVLIRIAMAIYLVSLPSCVQDANHFGPGFFPLLASFLLVPLFSFIAFSDAIKIWLEVIRHNNLQSKFITTIFLTLLAGGYGSLILFAILENGR